MTHYELNNCTNLSNVIDIMNSLTEPVSFGVSSVWKDQHHWSFKIQISDSCGQCKIWLESPVEIPVLARNSADLPLTEEI